MNKVVGFTCGSFDLFHPGHVMLLKYARDRCDELVVGLQTDPTIDRPHKRKPTQTTMERFIQLKACSFVGQIFPYDTERDLLNFLKLGIVDRRFIGEDYRHKRFTGDDLPIELVYVPRDHDWSSTYFVVRSASLAQD